MYQRLTYDWQSTKDLFGFESSLKVPVIQDKLDHVPINDPTYCFQETATTAILVGLIHNKRTLVTGLHGAGKSSHIEQVAARLNWPCMRINLDGHISRSDLIGKDAIKIEQGKQITQFEPGIIPWSIQRPILLVLDEYDAARPEVLFVLQRMMESEGKLTLIDQHRVIDPHPQFRLMATANTVGLGDYSGLYHGTHLLNQGQMDRWNIVVRLDYMQESEELSMLLAKIPSLSKEAVLLKQMVILANMTRTAFLAGDVSTLMSPRTVLQWAENYGYFSDLEKAFYLTFMNKCDESEKAFIAGCFQRCFDVQLPHFLPEE